MSILQVDQLAYPGRATPNIQFSSGGAFGFNGANYGTSGQVLQSNGSSSPPSWTTLSGGGAPTIQVFAGQYYFSNASYTYTPTSGKTAFLVYCIGGGAGSSSRSTSNGGFGGGSGGCAVRYYNSTEMGSSAAISIGGGGSGGTYTSTTPNYGNNGASSSFNPGGTGVTITGGAGSNTGQGGSTTNSQVDWKGNSGKNYWGASPGGGGGSLFWGAGRGGDGTFDGTNSNGDYGTGGCVVVFEF